MITKEKILQAMEAAHARGDSAAVAELGAAYNSGNYFNEDEYWRRAAHNLPDSAMGAVSNVVEMVTHPKDTVTNMGGLVAGAAQNLVPERYKSSMPDVMIRNEPLADAIGQEYKTNFGSAKGFNEYFSQDPVAALLDTSMVASIPSLALKGASKAASLSGAPKAAANFSDKAAQLSNLTQYLDPVKLASKTIDYGTRPVRSLIKNASGVSTGLGGETLQRITDAEARGYKPGDIEGLIPRFETALSAMKKDADTKYTTDILPISKDKKTLSISFIEDAIKKASELSYRQMANGKYVKVPEAKAVVDATAKELKYFKKTSGNVPNVMDLDAFKQRYYENVLSKTEFGTTANKIASKVFGSIKDTIKEQAPDYEKVMADYRDSATQMSDIKHATSMAANTPTSTTASKLFTLAENAADWEGRHGAKMRLANKLSKYDPLLLDDLAVHADAKALSRNSLPIGAATWLLGSPLTGTISLLSTSPKVAATIAKNVGKTKRLSNKYYPEKSVNTALRVGNVDKKARKFKLTLEE